MLKPLAHRERGRPSGASVLVVDDDPQVRDLLRALLEGRGDRPLPAGNVSEAREALTQHEVHLVLCDVDMPGGSGLELVRWMRLEHPDVAVVMVSAIDDAALAEVALDLGAYGYIIKPFRVNEVLIGVQNALRRRALEIENRDCREWLEQAVTERTAALTQTIAALERTREGLRSSQEETIHRLALAAEFRDEDTGRHVERVSGYATLLAERLGLEPELCELVRLASPLHDVGKIGVADEILRKPGPLTSEERRMIERHTLIGYAILDGSRSELLRTAAIVALNHHERFDGSGYPAGLGGDGIPIEGRIVAAADVFDALTSERPYRSALPPDEAVALMKAARGTQFDPAVLDAFRDSVEDTLLLRVTASRLGAEVANERRRSNRL